MYEVVELGGGDRPYYHPNLDLLSHPMVDIRCDLSSGILPLPDLCAQRIFSIDFIEHLRFDGFIELLKECKRVLIDGGIIEFITPDVAKAIETFPDINRHVANVIFGEVDANHPEKIHKTWWTPPMMVYVLSVEGWRDIKWGYYMKDVHWWKEPKFKVTAVK